VRVFDEKNFNQFAFDKSWCVILQAQDSSNSLRLGMIGLDTSHVIAFTRILNDASLPDHVSGGKVIAAYKGGSDDVESSYTRVDKFTEQLSNEFGVEIVDSIENLCGKVDAVLLKVSMGGLIWSKHGS
jgi:hypothetical protein